MSRAPELFTDITLLDARMTEWMLSRRGDDTDYLLVMKIDEGYSVHYRLDQPCYGELRKYKMTHGTMCTRPESEKPDDLFNPFPKGVPHAVVIPFHDLYHDDGKSEGRKHFLEFLVSEDSPWISGFGSPDKVEMIKKDEVYHGFILRDMHIDPTVMVQLIWATRDISHSGTFDRLVADGLTSIEAVAVLYANSSNDPYKIISEQDEYHFGSRLSLKRFFSKTPRDFTGGKYDEGYDYNRRMVQDIFYSDTGMLWKEEMVKVFGGVASWGPFYVKNPKDDLVPAIKATFAKALKEEKDLSDKPFPTEAPVMNPGNVFQISEGWGNYETGGGYEGGDYDEDYEDNSNYDDYGGDNCTCPDCVASRGEVA